MMRQTKGMNLLATVLAAMARDSDIGATGFVATVLPCRQLATSSWSRTDCMRPPTTETFQGVGGQPAKYLEQVQE